MGALLALASAVSYGLSDFLGGVLSRRASFIRVALLGQVGGLLSMGLLAPLFSGTVPAVADLGWGALSGIGTGLGMMFLFRGMSRGAMSVVVPVSAVGGVALPVLVGVVVLGERPALLAWAGIALALPALWAVSRGKAGDGQSAHAVVDGLISGGGIALQYLALAQAAPESAAWPVVAGRVTSILTIAALGATLHLSATRHANDGQRRCGLDLGAAFAGALAGLALLCYLLATRTALLTVAVVLSSLYPVIPALLGITVLRERLTPRQTVGLVAALAAPVLIATA
ncbi:EamA family transporter [Pseudonocardia parietis]|uniref:Drug/metabolite transporter (DMT)-like permease n=1 Tax=Pseudonocardia parietis TaxID=570936 RepID=A0ABS4VWV1_9PSEU|nr:EamA family transporter [Pseudonocardia parietis]MBP2368414.1 drug/metabolite transporter (DMT)-like permease [Pseudonocardia parietis]